MVGRPAHFLTCCYAFGLVAASPAERRFPIRSPATKIPTTRHWKLLTKNGDRRNSTCQCLRDCSQICSPSSWLPFTIRRRDLPRADCCRVPRPCVLCKGDAADGFCFELAR